MYENLDIFYFSSTHWDREWYQPFQGFRYRLVQFVNKLIDLYEKDKEYGTFHFDGQTIVLEDYAEIKPEKAQELKKLIEGKKVLVGPWYVMPDEFTVSGESLIRNLGIGHKVAKEWGGEPWKFGYICDIFGHIAQTPQIFKGFDIKYSAFARGADEERPAFFVWRAPDGSDVINYKMDPCKGYSSFFSKVYLYPEDPSADNPEIAENIKKYVDDELGRSNAPIVVFMDGSDHNDASVNTVGYIKKAKELFPGARVHHVNLCEMGKLLEKYDLPVIQAEFNETSKSSENTFLQLISNTLSSYYSIKKQNDECQTIMEKWFNPMLVFAKFDNIYLDKAFADKAYKLLISNHAHDSICGCSPDRVNEDMEYRYNQVKDIFQVVKEDYREHFRVTGYKEDDAHHIMTLFNPLPFGINKAVTVDIDFPQDYPVYFEPFGYENINKFKIYDCDGNEIPYVVTNIKRNSRRRYMGDWGAVADVHTITFDAKIPPCGRSEYSVVPSDTPAVRYMQRLDAGDDWMENEYIKVNILGNGSVEIYDKKTGKTYSQLGNLTDDIEIGDGWFHASAVNDRKVTTKGGSCTIEKIEHGPSRCVFSVTRYLEVPKEMTVDNFGKRRSNETVNLKFVTKIGLSKQNRYVDVELDFDNIAKDHRLRFNMPTGIKGGKYFAGQAFYCVERNVGINYQTNDWKEPDCMEKSTNGIVGKRDGNGEGIAFVSAYGLHECAGFDGTDGNIAITLLRAFRTTTRNDGGTKCQLNIPLNYKFALVPLDKDVEYSHLDKLQDELATEIMTVFTAVKPGTKANQPVSHLSVEGDNIVTSAIKCGEGDDNDIIVRVYNASDKPSKAKITINGEIKQADKVNLNEEFISNLSHCGNTVEFEVTPWHIETVLINK